jgi:hypothetical protein
VAHCRNSQNDQKTRAQPLNAGNDFAQAGSLNKVSEKQKTTERKYDPDRRELL